MHLFAMIALYLLCLFPPYSPVDPVAALDYTAAEYDYVVDDRTPTVELPGKQSHSLPQISFRIFRALGITAAATMLILVYCIDCHCRPLMYLSVILCRLLYLYYSAVNPAPCYLELD